MGCRERTAPVHFLAPRSTEAEISGFGAGPGFVFTFGGSPVARYDFVPTVRACGGARTRAGNEDQPRVRPQGRRY